MPFSQCVFVIFLLFWGWCGVIGLKRKGGLKGFFWVVKFFYFIPLLVSALKGIFVLIFRIAAIFAFFLLLYELSCFACHFSSSLSPIIALSEWVSFLLFAALAL